MAITFDNAWTISTGSSGASITITCAANAVLFAFAEVAAGSVSAMTLNGSSFTSLGGAQTQTIQAWIFSAPPTGVSTFKIHWPIALQFSVMLASYTGHNTTTYTGNCRAQSSGAANNFNVSVSATTGDLVIVGFRCTSATADVVTINNGTLRIAPFSDSSRAICALADIAGATSITISATCVVAHAWDAVAIPLHYSAGTITVIPLQNLLSVGL